MSWVDYTEDEKVKLLFLKRKSLYVLALVGFEIYLGIQKAIVFDDIKFAKFELYPHVSNFLFLAYLLNALAIELSLYVHSNNVEAKKVSKFKPPSYICIIPTIVKKVSQPSIKQNSNFHYFIPYLYKILHGQL